MATATQKGATRRHAPDTLESVRYLRRHTKLTESDLADGTGANARTVRRWLAADCAEPRPAYARHIDDLRLIVGELEDSLTARGIRQWLRARSRYLDGERPIDLLRQGEFKKVHEAALAFREGDYI